MYRHDFMIYVTIKAACAVICSEDRSTINHESDEFYYEYSFKFKCRQVHNTKSIILRMYIGTQICNSINFILYITYYEGTLIFASCVQKLSKIFRID